MTIIQAIVFGIIQGIAEFLPISSSGHLALVQNFSNIETEMGFTFNIALHLATLISVCVAYRKDVYLLIKGGLSFLGKLFGGKIKNNLDNNEKMFLALVVATLPLIPVKLLGLDETVENLSAISWIIGLLLIFNGIMLIISDKIKKGNMAVEDGGFARPLGVGIVQALLGVMPGISRSGSTITGGRMLGYSREEAVRFSFLMSIPAIVGACVFELPDMFAEGVSSEIILPVLIGAVVASVVGFFAIKLLQYLARNKSFTFFAIYCIIVGIVAIVADMAI